jgi:hypothetical protein
MQHEVSLWAPLGLEMTTEPLRASQPILFHPPATQAGPVVPRPARAGQHRLRLGLRLARQRPDHPRAGSRRPVRRQLQNLAGAAMIVAAVGAIVDLATGWLGGSRNILLYRAYVAGDLVLDLRTGKPEELATWLDSELGAPVGLPAVDGFHLVGGTAELPGNPDSAAGAFASEGVPVLLVIERKDGAPDAAAAPPALAVEDGLTRLDWHEGALAYSLVSALPPEKLALFAGP